MSLVSLENLVSPVTNVVNLTAIVLVALLFGAWRLMDGGLSFESVDGKQRVRHEQLERHRQNQEQVPRTTVSRTKPSNARAPFDADALQRTLRAQEEDLLKNVLGNNRQQPARRAAPKKADTRPAPSEGSSGGLDDIERTLGLR